MDRIQFIQSIEYEDFEKSIVRFFDENMLLYNLVGGYVDIKCITGNVNEKHITFDLSFNTSEDMDKMYLFLDQNKVITIYESEYEITSNKTDNNIINIILIQIKR